MTVLADRESKASGTTTKPEPPPQLPGVDAAQQFYIYGTAASATFHWHTRSFGYGAYVRYAEPTPSRLDQLLALVASELIRLRELRPGWDGHRGKQITPEALNTSLAVLATVLDENSEPPQIFPLPDGGIQVEWYSDEIEIEIEINGAGQAHLLAAQTGGASIAEGIFDPYLPSDLAAVAAVTVKDLSERIAAERQRT